MKKWVEEFKDNDYQGEAAKRLSLFIENNPSYRVTIVGYNVVRYEQINQDRTYILVEVEV